MSHGRIVHRVELVADENAVRIQPYVVGYFLCYVLVVAGHDNHGDAILLECLQDGKHSLGGSRNAAKPTSVIACSAATVYASCF